MAAPTAVRTQLTTQLSAAWDAHTAGQDYNLSARVQIAGFDVKIRITWLAANDNPSVVLVLRRV